MRRVARGLGACPHCGNNTLFRDWHEAGYTLICRGCGWAQERHRNGRVVVPDTRISEEGTRYLTDKERDRRLTIFSLPRQVYFHHLSILVFRRERTQRGTVFLRTADNPYDARHEVILVWYRQPTKIRVIGSVMFPPLPELSPDDEGRLSSWLKKQLETFLGEPVGRSFVPAIGGPDGLRMFGAAPGYIEAARKVEEYATRLSEHQPPLPPTLHFEPELTGALG